MDSTEQVDQILTELLSLSDDFYLRKFFEYHSVLFSDLVRDESVHSSQILAAFQKYCEIANISKSSISTESSKIIEKLSSVISEIITSFDDNFLKTKDFLIKSSARVASALEKIARIVELLSLILKKLSCGKPTLEENIDFTSHFGSILYVIFRHCRNYETVQKELPSALSVNIRILFAKSNEMLDDYFKFVQSLSVECDNKEDMDRLISVINRIFSIGITVSGLDLKTMALFWKYFLNLLKPYAGKLQGEFDVLPIFEFFYEEIHNKIKFLYKDTDTDSRNLVLKVLCFLLKVIVKLCYYWNGSLHKCVKTFLRLIFLLYDHSVACGRYSKMNSELKPEVDSSLLAGVDSLVSYLINDPSFIQNFSVKNLRDAGGDENKPATLLLLSTILQKLISCSEDVQELWLEHSILHVSFSMVSEFHEALFYEIKLPIISYSGIISFREIFLYDALLVYVSSLLVCNFAEKIFDTLEKTLVVHFLQSPVLVKIFISDLWCIIDRYGSSELCLKHIKYLLSVLDEIHEGKTEAVMLSFLIRRLFNFLTPSHQINLFEMIGDNSSIIDFIQAVPENRNIIQKVFSEVSHLRCSNPKLEDSVRLLKFATVIGEKKKFVDEGFDFLVSDSFLLEQWAVIVKTLISLQFENLDQIADFISYASDLTASCLISVSQASTLQILKFLKQLFLCESVLVQLNTQKILRVCGSVTFENPSIGESITLLGILFRICLQSRHTIVRQYALESFSYFSHVTIHETIIQKIISNDGTLKESLAVYLQKKLPRIDGEKTIENFVIDLLRVSGKTYHNKEADQFSEYDEVETCDNLVYNKVREAETVLDNLLLIVTSKQVLKAKEKDELNNLFYIVDELRKFM